MHSKDCKPLRPRHTGSYLCGHVIDALRKSQSCAIDTLGQECCLYRQGTPHVDPDECAQCGDPTGFYFTTRRNSDYLYENQCSGKEGDCTGTRVFEFSAPEHIIPGTVNVFYGPSGCREVLMDDGFGHLVGSGTGWVDYDRGVIHAEFTVAPECDVPVLYTLRATGPLQTKVWLKWPQPKDLPDTGFGTFLGTEELPVIAYFKAEDKVRPGDWFKVFADFESGGRYYSSFEVTHKNWRGIEKQGLDGFYVVPSRRQTGVDPCHDGVPASSSGGHGH